MLSCYLYIFKLVVFKICKHLKLFDEKFRKHFAILQQSFCCIFCVKEYLYFLTLIFLYTFQKGRFWMAKAARETTYWMMSTYSRS